MEIVIGISADSWKYWRKNRRSWIDLMFFTTMRRILRIVCGKVRSFGTRRNYKNGWNHWEILGKLIILSLRLIYRIKFVRRSWNLPCLNNFEGSLEDWINMNIWLYFICINKYLLYFVYFHSVCFKCKISILIWSSLNYINIFIYILFSSWCECYVNNQFHHTILPKISQYSSINWQ